MIRMVCAQSSPVGIGPMAAHNVLTQRIGGVSVTHCAALSLIGVIALWFFADQIAVPRQIVRVCVVVVLALSGWIIQNHWVSLAAADTATWVSTRIA